jgi:hypothetical protein
MIRINRSDHNSLRFLVFKLNKITGKRKAEGNEEEDLGSLGGDDNEGALNISNAAVIVQEVFATKEEMNAIFAQKNNPSILNRRGIYSNADIERQRTLGH